jgi:MerR family transcriptional regulator/heat shock protein HspR
MASYIQEITGTASDEPMFVISVAARLVEMHPQTLRYYERAGLVKPKRSRGSIRLYSQRDIERLKKIARLIEDLGVNLAGVEVIINLTEKLELMQNLLEANQIQVPATQVGDGTVAERVTIQVRRPRKARAVK